MRAAFLALALLLAASQGRAADPLTAAVAEFYPAYRAALFRTNNGPPDAALAAVTEAAQHWRGVTARFTDALPVPYAEEREWPALARRIGAILEQAQAEAAAGRLPHAHETLEEVRELLGALRARNGVFTFSDAMDAYHAEMERAAPLAAEGPARLADLRELAGVLHFLAGRLLPAAPPALRADPEFAALEAANRAAVEAFRSAVRMGDPAAIAQAAAALRGPYSRLFLRFG